jgi:sugar phosphate isomerase/epimerase
MLALPDDATKAPKIQLSEMNFGFFPMVNDQTRLQRRFYEEVPAMEAARGAIGQALDADAALALGLAAGQAWAADLPVQRVRLPREPKALQEAVAKYKAANITIMGAGVLYMKNEPEKVRKDFEYARDAGVPLIIAAPDPDALDLVEGMVKEFNIPLAIHNHGPEDKHYPGPSDVMKHIAKRDKRIGVCMDVGHTVRAGEDPVALVNKLGARLFDLHVKDLKDPKDKASQIESGKGVVNLVGLCRALQKRNYQGQVGLEYEIHENEPLPGIAESLAYLRGVIAGISA